MNKRQECATKNCGWVGVDREKKSIPRNREYGRLPISDLVCPKCNNPEFYMIDK